jgi:hypothetical protein
MNVRLILGPKHSTVVELTSYAAKRGGFFILQALLLLGFEADEHLKVILL